MVKEYGYDVNGDRLPVMTARDVLALPNGTMVAGMLPIGVEGAAKVLNGRFKVTSHKVPRTFADFCPTWAVVNGQKYVVEG